MENYYPLRPEALLQRNLEEGHSDELRDSSEVRALLSRNRRSIPRLPESNHAVNLGTFREHVQIFDLCPGF